jgi:hypothetical protein
MELTESDALAMSLANNSTLKTLRLYNTNVNPSDIDTGESGERMESISMALKVNSTLTVLDLFGKIYFSNTR